MEVSATVHDMELPKNKVCTLTTVGAPAMTGEQNGLTSTVFRKFYDGGSEGFKVHNISHRVMYCSPLLYMAHIQKSLANPFVEEK